jgi:hypothetical protein
MRPGLDSVPPPPPWGWDAVRSLILLGFAGVDTLDNTNSYHSGPAWRDAPMSHPGRMVNIVSRFSKSWSPDRWEPEMRRGLSAEQTIPTFSG